MFTSVLVSRAPGRAGRAPGRETFGLWAYGSDCSGVFPTDASLCCPVADVPAVVLRAVTWAPEGRWLLAERARFAV